MQHFLTCTFFSSHFLGTCFFGLVFLTLHIYTHTRQTLIVCTHPRRKKKVANYKTKRMCVMREGEILLNHWARVWTISEKKTNSRIWLSTSNSLLPVPSESHFPPFSSTPWSSVFSTSFFLTCTQKLHLYFRCWFVRCRKTAVSMKDERAKSVLVLVHH